MTYSLFILDKAKEDAKKSTIWYNEQQSGLGRRFVDALDKTITKIRQNPLHFGRRYLEIRAAKVERFPYKVFFIVSDKELTITAILHDSRNPQIWKKRS